jgi:ABC-type Fe3+ transport system permease subunit
VRYTRPVQRLPLSTLAVYLAAAVLLSLLTAAVLFPAGFVVAEIIAVIGQAPRMLMLAARDFRLLGLTIGVAGLIAVIATALALPAAWATRAWRGPVLMALLIPMLLPSYLAYSGWGLLRAPGTRLGNWLMMGGGAGGANLYPVIAGQVLAVMGLALWVWPLAWLVLLVRIRMLDPASLDALRLGPVPRWRKTLVVLGMIRPGILAAIGAAFLIMLGSAVPFHVAQLDTYAIAIWRALDETPHARHGLVWIRSWPLILIALIAALAITRLVATPPSGRGERLQTGRGEWPGKLWVAALWGFSVLGPLVLFILSLGGWRSIATFWRITATPIANSFSLAAATAALGVVVGGAMWYLAAIAGSMRRRWLQALVWFSLAAFLVAGLMPGVLVGSAMARAYASAAGLAPIADSWVLLALGHVARFGFIPALAGVFLARAEPAELRDLRLLEAGPSFFGWLRTAAAPAAGRLGALAGVSLALGLLSFHEIEATVMLQPPTGLAGGGGSFAWRMLQNLHFARMEELSAGVVIVTVGGLATCAAIFILARALMPRQSPQAP